MKYLIIPLMFVATVAQAECLTRVKTNISRAAINSRPTDIQKMVIPEGSNQRCVMRYRIHIGTDWQTVEGEGVGRNAAEACVQAIRPEVGSILSDVEYDRVTAETQMVCSDFQDIHVRKVHAGERIWESEAEIHNNPAEQKYFVYKDTQCRYFIERGAKEQNMYLYQGIMCRETKEPTSKWLVVDKY